MRWGWNNLVSSYIKVARSIGIPTVKVDSYLTISQYYTIYVI